ncbi:MAG: 30S ribosomal protein S12 methylthiotransferase RimO [Candidatus Omnitrophota bacterium]
MMLHGLDAFNSRRLREEDLSSRHSSFAVISLGCARNTVDSQNIIAEFAGKGGVLTSLEKADTVIVNTCAFIESAKRESIDTILELEDLKAKGRIKKIIVAGCLSQRYGDALASELKGVDGFIGVQPLTTSAPQASVLLTPAHYAYVKICESCYNACSFCVIPRIKGKFVSRGMDEVLDDVRQLNARGVREINFIGQDVTAYGLDIYGRRALAELIANAAKVSSGWIRLLYAHPSHITDELLEVMASYPVICRYLDMPLQHVSDKILRQMNRPMTRAAISDLIVKIRRMVPGISLRTTFITGFPGETEKDFRELLSFLEEHPFERVGVFIYSREEGTPAYDLPGRVSAKVAQRRYDALMKTQQGVAARLNARLVGQTFKVLIDERAEGDETGYVGRSAFDAPEVDGVVYVRAKKPLCVGDFAMVRISGAMDYDLEGEAL